MHDFLINKTRFPFQAFLFTGAISILIVIAGSAGFLVLQHNLLEKVEKKEACYLDLVDFRLKLMEFGFMRDQTNQSEATDDKQARVLLFMYEKLVTEMQNAGLQPNPSLQKAREELKELRTDNNFDIFRLELENTIAKAKIESMEASKELVAINQFFLFFILAVLLTLSITAGLLLHNNYRQTVIPLSLLAGQLKLINRNIPESIHETAVEMKKELTGAEHSSDITQITESIMGFCNEIEAKNKKLDEIHIRDEKTNLYNYRHFKEHLIIEVERARRQNEKVSLAMIDIDCFKHYNDTNGHIAGDRVLKVFADIISNQCRLSDVPSRFGGDEFAVLFPKTDSITAREVAERLRKTISAQQFSLEGEQPCGQLTISLGVATFPGDASDWQTLINNADRALYMAKFAGRNNVVTFATMKTRPGKTA